MWEGSRLRSTDFPSHGRQGPLTGELKKGRVFFDVTFSPE
jgi:hypothetical protein